MIIRVHNGTALVRLRDFYPECLALIDQAPKLSPLVCLRPDMHLVCHVNRSCFDKLVVRMEYIFDQFPAVNRMLVYWKYRDLPGSMRACMFWRDPSQDPRMLGVRHDGVINPRGWAVLEAKCQEWYDWIPAPAIWELANARGPNAPLVTLATAAGQSIGA